MPLGPDSTINICGGPGTTIFLINMLVDSANLFGYYEDITEIDGFDSTGVFNASGLFGTFEFMYIVEGIGECPTDTSFLTVIIDPGPSAYFTYEVDGFSSADGFTEYMYFIIRYNFLMDPLCQTLAS